MRRPSRPQRGDDHRLGRRGAPAERRPRSPARAADPGGGVDVRTPAFRRSRRAARPPSSTSTAASCWIHRTRRMPFSPATTSRRGSTIVHQSLVSWSPAPDGQGGMTNGAIMQMLDAESPTVWLAVLGAAGDGVDPSGCPSRGPGQGIVSYPAGWGCRSAPPTSWLCRCTTTSRDLVGRKDGQQLHPPALRRQRNRRLAFILPESSSTASTIRTPTCCRRKKPAPLHWIQNAASRSRRHLSVDLVAVMPHMHGRGLRQQLRIGPPGTWRAPPASRTGTSLAGILFLQELAQHHARHSDRADL